jgi:hypothetical protein
MNKQVLALLSDLRTTGTETLDNESELTWRILTCAVEQLSTNQVDNMLNSLHSRLTDAHDDTSELITPEAHDLVVGLNSGLLPGNTVDHFVSEMIRCRGIEFAQVGMMVEVSGEIGTIKGMGSSANLEVLFSNVLKHGNQPRTAHPTWKVKYFDAAGTVIAHFDESGCVFRPDRKAANVA